MRCGFSRVVYGFMMGQALKVGICIVLLAWSYGYAEVVYTWTDSSGTIHLSNSRPPENVRQSIRLSYSPSKPEIQKDGVTGPAAAETESSWFSALEEAKRQRRQAQQARETAEIAIQEANRLKQETDEFLKPWRNKSRIKRPMLQQIDRRVQTANQAIEHAQALIQKANEAEQHARYAEVEAQRVQQALFETYRQILSE